MMDNSRREFLFKGLVIAGFGAVGTALAWIFGSVWTAAGRFSSTGWVQVAPVDRFSPGTVTPFPEYKIAVVRATGKIGAIGMECTHLGCLVNVIDRGFFCPCHGSEFGPLGEAYSGPATEPLPWFEVANRAGRLWVRMDERLASPKWLEVKEVAGSTRGRA